jgi:hypothetical protein
MSLRSLWKKVNRSQGDAFYGNKQGKSVTALINSYKAVCRRNAAKTCGLHSVLSGNGVPQDRLLRISRPNLKSLKKSTPPTKDQNTNVNLTFITRRWKNSKIPNHRDCKTDFSIYFRSGWKKKSSTNRETDVFIYNWFEVPSTQIRAKIHISEGSSSKPASWLPRFNHELQFHPEPSADRVFLNVFPSEPDVQLRL